MTTDHPNISVLKKLDLRDLGSAENLFSQDFVWHYFNTELPDLEGDYHGLDGLKSFFRKLAGKTAGTFNVEPLSITAMGDEFVIVHVRDTMTLDAQSVALDAVVVWRIVEGLIAEAWDIPAINTVSVLGSSDTPKR
ncbi:nuclear transport factor 2 family protein [Hoeflea sp. TYP-13]|uniref:nuclear transport factor 2 family protein n=1 Tax=Hoeflea sp. TYP-13 TaxID=3230023 RepID=UPI0034C6BCC7